ncbi:hypothetical protein ACFW88_30655, partial [Streptomyces anandii]
ARFVSGGLGVVYQRPRRYRDLAPEAGPAQRHALRRSAYHRLAEARRAAAHAHDEPGRPGRRLPDWQRAIGAAERLCDAVSARNLSARPGPVPVERSAGRPAERPPALCGALAPVRD